VAILNVGSLKTQNEGGCADDFSMRSMLSKNGTRIVLRPQISKKPQKKSRRPQPLHGTSTTSGANQSRY